MCASCLGVGVMMGCLSTIVLVSVRLKKNEKFCFANYALTIYTQFK